MEERRLLQVTPSLGIRPAFLAFVGALVGAASGWACWRMAAAGHGTYVPAIAIFPFTMLLAILMGPISPPLIVLALAQFPIYGFILARATEPGARLRLARRVGAIHLLVAVGAAVCAVLKEGYLP